MNRVCRFFTILFCQILCIQQSFATIKLNWQDCQTHFNKNNPSTKAAEFILKNSEFQTMSAAAGYWPKLTLSANTLLDSSNKSPKDTSANLTLTQNLFSGFTTEASVKQAEANLQISKSQFIETYSTLVYNLKVTYADLFFAQQTDQLLNDIIFRRQQNYDLVKLRFSNGKEHKGSLLQAEAYLKLAQFEKFQNQNVIRLAQQKLKTLLDLDEDHIELTDSIPNTAEFPDYQSIVIHHPDHQQALAQIDLAEANLKSSKSSYFPSLDLQFSYQSSGSWTTGLQLSWGLFNGGKNYYDVQGQIELKNAKNLQLLTADQALVEKLFKAKNNYLESVQKYNVDLAFLNAAVVREQISHSKYNNGLSTFEDWDQLESDLINRQKNQLRSEYDRIISLAAWLKVQGKGTSQ